MISDENSLNLNNSMNNVHHCIHKCMLKLSVQRKALYKQDPELAFQMSKTSGAWKHPTGDPGVQDTA